MSDWFEKRMKDPKFAQQYRIECFIDEALDALYCIPYRPIRTVRIKE